MKISLDLVKCSGYGNCVVAEPRVFDLNDDDKVTLLDEDPGEELREDIMRAARECPVSAIEISD